MRENQPIRFGILGNAAIFQEALRPAFAKTSMAEIAAIASSKKFTENGSSVKTYWGPAAYQELLNDPEIDAVYIPLPNHLHKEWTVKAAAAGKHVLCEKPLGVNAEEAEEMIQACRSNGVHLMEAFMYRYNSQHPRCLEIVASGEIGDLRLARVGFSVPLAKPDANIRFGPYAGAGALHDVGSYGINLCRWMFGSEPVQVQAFASYLPGTEADILHVLNLEFPDGKLATVSGGLGQAYRSFYELVGTKGRIEVERPFASPPFVISEGPLRLKVITEYGQREEVFDDESQYVPQIEEFCRLVNGHPNSAYGPEDSVKNMRVLDACMASIKSGASELLQNGQVGAPL
jgi:xylose dehydrogenase (NAD/NADP)